MLRSAGKIDRKFEIIDGQQQGEINLTKQSLPLLHHQRTNQFLPECLAKQSPEKQSEKILQRLSF